jgi:hypothetical protein
MCLTSFLEKATAFEIPSDQYEKVEKGRIDFFKKFPEENL